MSRPKSDFVQRIVKELDSKKGSLSAAEAAKLVRLSESRVRHVFTHSAGITFRRTRLYARIGLGLEFLLQTHMSIPEISEKLGYSNRSAFERAFKKMFGITPAGYRQQQ